MKNPVLILGILCVVGISESFAINPKSKNDPLNSQEATEQSVLPGEPALVEPTPEPPPESANLQVQPLPQPSDEVTPSGPTQDDLRKKAEAFRAAKTEAEEQPFLINIKNQAEAAATERQKRTFLSEYYKEVQAYLVKKSPSFKEDAEAWAYGKQMRMAQTRTDPHYVAPTMPASLAKTMAKKAAASPSPAAHSGILPSLEN